jgi:hypothetical protein
MKTCVRHWKVFNGGYWHHFLDFRRYPPARLLWGYDCMVELVRNPNPAVRRTNWETVVDEAEGNQPVLVREMHVDLDRIFQCARQKLNWSWYNLLLYNCEHFANECMVGVRRSVQVRARTMQAATAFAAGVGGAALLARPAADPLSMVVGFFLAGVSLILAALFTRFVVRSRAATRRFRRRLARQSAQETDVQLAV